MPTPPRRFLAALAISFAAVAAFGQAVARDEADAKAVKSFEAGVQAAFEGNAKQAVRYLKAALEREPDFAEALVELAGVYYNAGEYAAAEDYLERVVALGGDERARGLYGLAMAELRQDKFAEASDHLTAYLAGGELRDDRRAAAERYLAEATFKSEALAAPLDLTLHRLPPAVNTPGDAEYLPSLTADANTLIFTRRVGGRDEDFYVARRENGEWQPAQPMTAVNTPENEGAQTVSADGKLLVFTGCNRRDGLGSCDLYFAVNRDGAWSEPRNLGAPVNTAAWESQPSLSANGQLLFFASKRPGGLGGADLYASGRTPDGGWGEPINLGPAVNTPRDDQAPFFHADGATLYFMSDGHPGMGEFDMFLTRLDSVDTWSPPRNLGYPLNTPGTEGPIVVALDGRTGYFASDLAPPSADPGTPSSPGDSIRLSADSIGVGAARAGVTDLFSLDLPPALRAGPVTYLEARVIDAATEEPIGAVAELQRAGSEKVFLRRRARASDGTFLAVLPAGAAYALNVSEPGYLFFSDRFELAGATSIDEPFRYTIRLQRLPDSATNTAGGELEPVVLRNVLFATGSADLLAESAAELTVLRELLTDRPAVRVRIQGHTDDVGAPADNLALSERRARAVRDYLIAEGIAGDRVEAVGFGEARPLTANDSDAARAQNRRTEFVIEMRVE